MNAIQNKTACQVIFNELDINPTFTEDKNGWFVTEAYPISTSRIGIMAAMIETLSVKIRVGFAEGQEHKWMYISYDFKYTHPNGGSNGYEVRKEVKM